VDVGKRRGVKKIEAATFDKEVEAKRLANELTRREETRI